MSSIKYYCGKIEERNGDMEYNTTFFFKTSGDPDKYCDKTAKTWRSGNSSWDKIDGGYWNDNTLIAPGSTRELTLSTWTEMIKEYGLL